MTEAERIARLETEMVQLKVAHQEAEAERKAHWDEVNKKLDELLALRNKGVGAFWVASSLLGTGILGLFWEVIGWFKHGS